MNLLGRPLINIAFSSSKNAKKFLKSAFIKAFSSTNFKNVRILF